MATTAALSVSPSASIKTLLARTHIFNAIDKNLCDTAKLPVKLLVVIGQFLAGGEYFSTLAALNVTCRSAHEETLPNLYETFALPYTATLQRDYCLGFASVSKVCSGLKFVKYLVIEETPNDMPGIAQDNAKLPALRALIFKGFQPESEALLSPLRSSRKKVDIKWIPCTVFIHQPIRQDTLATLIISDSSTRQAVVASPEDSTGVEKAIEKAANYIIERIVELTVNQRGRIIETSRPPAARASTVTWLLTPADLLLDVEGLKGGQPEALKVVSQILDAGLASDLINFRDTAFHLTVQCSPSMLPGLFSIRGAYLADRRILTGLMLADEIGGTPSTALDEIINLVSDGAECYLDGRIAKFRDLKVTRDRKDYKGIVDTNRWWRQIPRQWDPEWSMFGANICSEPWYDGFIPDDNSSNSEEDGMVFAVTAYAADTQTSLLARKFGLYVTITKHGKGVESRIVFEKHYTKPAIL